ADGLGFTFVSDRAEQVLGYPRSQWLEEGFWPGVVHPDDRDEVTACRARSTAAARDFDLTYRAVAADGRVLWLHDVVHVVRDADGVARRLQGVMIDVTQRKRAERFAAVLAESSRLLAGPEDARFRLAALAQLVRDVFGDFVVVSVRDPDGRFRRVAAAHPDPETERLLADLPPIRVPPDRAEQFRRGDPVVIPLDGEMAARIADDEHDVHALISLLASQTLVVPLVSAGRLLGAITFFTGGESRAYDDADLTLAEELGRRAAAMVAAEAARRRERHIQQVTADLASSDGVVEAAGRLTERMVEILGAGAAAFYLAEPDRTLRLNHHVGYSAKLMKAFATIPGGARVPVADAFRTGEAVWVGSREEWEQHYPSIIPLARGNGMVASAAVPLFAGGRALGAIALSFPDARDFAPDEREFVLALAAQVAPAFERAALADERRHVAETLQRSLLPKGLPTIEGLGFAARYLPGVAGVAAGGDWYDVLPLDGDRVAVAVGDVVGQGAAAAAVMGQLRSALAAYLLEGHAPHAALDRLHRFAGTLDGATGSTAICVVVNPHTGELEWARAGHPPPLLLTADGARYLPEIPGAVLGMRDRPPSAAGRAALGPGSTVLLYTDGLVERRGQVIDEGLGRLARVAAALRAEPAEVLATRLLDRCLAPNGPADDVALIVTRVVPVPLRLRLPAEAARLRELRRAVGGWAEAADLPDELTYDLQLAIGEAAANVVEHAYRDRAHGPLEVELWYDAGPAVHARVRDVGVWRPRRADPGYRGRGLDLIQAVAQEAVVEPGPDGTEVRFRISVPGDA
ncbi:MAG TPA: SpoIIE family protein phosphatase, partial [Pseudonocardia sp.]|nr:SpoIIE family protein phosphatase [Pseudonocardia sp.]